MALMELQDRKDTKDTQVSEVTMENQVQKPEPVFSLVIKNKVSGCLRVSPAPTEILCLHQVCLVLRGPEAAQGIQVFLGNQVQMALLDCRVARDLKVRTCCANEFYY